jgi:hypothetical protein
MTCLFQLASLLPLSALTIIINNYSPKARWLSVNKNQDEVEVFIFTIITEPEVNNCFSIFHR